MMTASTWERVAQAGTAVSALAALIASGAALYQVRNSNTALDDLTRTWAPMMEQLLAETATDARVMALRPLFAREGWQPITLQALWQSPEVQAMAMTEDDFLAWLSRHLDGPFVYSIRDHSDRDTETLLIAWDPRFRLAPDVAGQ